MNVSAESEKPMDTNQAEQGATNNEAPKDITKTTTEESAQEIDGVGDLAEAMSLERKININQIREGNITLILQSIKSHLGRTISDEIVDSKLYPGETSPNTEVELSLRKNRDKPEEDLAETKKTIDRASNQLAEIQPENQEGEAAIESLKEDMKEFAKDDQARKKLELFAQYQTPDSLSDISYDDYRWEEAWKKLKPGQLFRGGRGGGEATTLQEVVAGFDFELSRHKKNLKHLESQESNANHEHEEGTIKIYEAALQFVEDNCDGRFQEDADFIAWQRAREELAA